MSLVICNSIGSIDLCRGCGAAKPHLHGSCEPCPVNKEAHCIVWSNIPSDHLTTHNSNNNYHDEAKEWEGANPSK